LSQDIQKVTFDFEKCALSDLTSVDWKFEHKITKTAILHGYCLYFDAFFEGTDKTYILETGPDKPVTHWY